MLRSLWTFRQRRRDIREAVRRRWNSGERALDDVCVCMYTVNWNRMLGGTARADSARTLNQRGIQKGQTRDPPPKP